MQLQLSQKLHISRTAVSKWESGRGFPNIEALKNISGIFEVPIDELLSGEELLDAAQKDSRIRQQKLISLIFGIYDIMIIAFIFIPLYGEKRGDFIQTVSLLEWSNHSWLRTSYFILFSVLSFYGMIEVILHFSENPKVHRFVRVCSMILHSFAVLVFISTREPYINSLMFLLLLSKTVFLIRKT